MSTDFGQFGDPALKAAIRRVYAEENAPPALRARIAAALAEESGSPPLRLSEAGSARARPHRANTWSSRLNVYGLAASLGIVAFLGAYLAWLRPLPASDIGQATLVAMVKTHDLCCGHEDHFMPGIPRDGCVAAGKAIGRELNETVLAANLAADGWEYRGAAICPVGEVRSAHLVYARGAQRLSVFSLPASMCSGAREGDICVREVNSHVIAGLVRTGGVFSMVGHCPKNLLKSQEVAELLLRHQGEMVSQQLALHGPEPVQPVPVAQH